MLIVGIVYSAKNRLAINRPSAMALIVLGLSTSLHYTAGFHYRDEIDPSTWMLLFSLNILMVFFAFLGETLGIHRKAHSSSGRAEGMSAKGNLIPPKAALTRICTYAFFLVGSFCVLALIFNNGPVLLRSGIDGLRISVYNGDLGENLLGRISRFAGFLFFSLGLIILSPETFSRRENRLLPILIGIQCLVMSILTAGRWPLMTFCITMFMTIRIDHAFLALHYKRIAGAMLIVILFLALMPLLRFAKDDPILSNKIAFDLEYSLRAEEALYAVPSVLSSTYLSIATYLTQGPAYLQNYLSSRDSPSGGILHFPWIYRLLNLRQWSAYEEAQDNLRAELIGEARFTEIWATGLRELIFDFGFFGAGLVCAIWGFIVGYIYGRPRTNADIALTMLYVSMVPMILFFPIASPYANTFMMYMINNGLLLSFPFLVLKLFRTT